MKWFSEKTIDIVQWIFIAVLAVMLIVQGINYRQAKKDLVTSAEIIKKNTYTRIYESQKLNKLKKENKELYDSISKMQDVESGMIIKFVEKYKSLIKTLKLGSNLNIMMKPIWELLKDINKIMIQ